MNEVDIIMQAHEYSNTTVIAKSSLHILIYRSMMGQSTTHAK